MTSPTAPHFWLALNCFGGGPGVDSEADGKMNTPAVGFSACSPGLPTDCVEPAFGGAMTFDQDECYYPSDMFELDAGVFGPLVFPACSMYAFHFALMSCETREVFLNICVDWNQDGDWNDVLPCVDAAGAPACAQEWAVKNAPFAAPIGCHPSFSPPFLVGPKLGDTWFRISLTQEPVPDDYPWNGSAGTPSGFFLGGETEDYPASIELPVPTLPQTWGATKARYR